MRLAPIPIAWQRNPARAMELCAESSRTTHGAREAIDACRYYGGLILGALEGRSKEEILSPLWLPPGVDLSENPLCESVVRVAQGSFKTKEPPEIQGNGYVIRSMEAALWAFFKTDDFRSGCLLAANLGQDADTTAAIYGQLAGALYGRDQLPSEWLARLAQRATIEELALNLFRLSANLKAQ